MDHVGWKWQTKSWKTINEQRSGVAKSDERPSGRHGKNDVAWLECMSGVDKETRPTRATEKLCHYLVVFVRAGPNNFS